MRGPAWHGPSMLDLVDGVSAAAAAAKPMAGGHSIHELVAHAAAWLEIAGARVAGTAKDPVTENENWPAVGAGARDWTATVSRLDAAASDLAALVRSLPDERLDDALAREGDTWTVYDTLHGAVQHLLYHAGQVALLRKGL